MRYPTEGRAIEAHLQIVSLFPFTRAPRLKPTPQGIVRPLQGVQQVIERHPFAGPIAEEVAQGGDAAAAAGEGVKRGIDAACEHLQGSRCVAGPLVDVPLLFASGKGGAVDLGYLMSWLPTS
jgi:hypothetical protein